MKAQDWFYRQSFTSANRETITVGEYANVPAEHHIHFCATCQKDYPCTNQHRRTDGTPDTPPRATKRCPECAFMGY